MTANSPEMRARLDASIRAARTDLARRAAQNPYRPVTDETLAAAQAEATARAKADLLPPDAARAMGAVLPPNVQAAARLPVVNPKLWDEDVKTAKPVKREMDINGWLTRVRDAARNTRQPGDPYAANIGRAAEALVYRLRIDGVGFARITFEGIARFAGFCIETGRKAVRFMEARGLLDTFNVITRTPDGEVWRAANLYFPRDLGPPEPEPSAMGVLGRVTDRLRRFASVFGLKARKWGLNATPLAIRSRSTTPVQDSG